MYDKTTVPGPEYRVRTVVRYMVTRYCYPYTERTSDPSGAEIAEFEIPGGSTVVGEFPNEQQAFDVAKALAKAEEPFGATVSV